MKILLTFKASPELSTAYLLSDNVMYRPDLEAKGSHLLRNTLLTLRPDMLITKCVPPSSVLQSWNASINGKESIVIVCSTESSDGQPPGDGQPIFDADSNTSIYYVSSSKTNTPELDALILAESVTLNRVFERDTRKWTKSPSRGARGARSEKRDIAMVGAGIVNLVSAYYLLREGHRITFYDSRSEPKPGYEWQGYGCTFSGSDARIFSFNESRHHHYKGSVVNADTNLQFRRPISEKGWLCCRDDDLTSIDHRWIEEFESVHQWMLEKFDREICGFNVESYPLWRRMMEQSPELFEDVGFQHQLLRTYPTLAKFENASAKEAQLGSLLRPLDPAAVADKFPGLREAVELGHIAGALEVIGFSLNVHRFAKKLIQYILDHGFSISWNTPVTGIQWNDSREVCGLRIGDEIVKADHYIVSSGAFGNELLLGTASFNRIAGVVGMWITLPNLAPKLDCPLKISRAGYASESAAEGANAIVGQDDRGQDVIYISSGHGYIGVGAMHLRAQYLDDLARAVEDTAERYFPSKYQGAKDMGYLSGQRRYCIRPWTPTGLGIFETIRSDTGGALFITGGHNTGGFAQAPSVASAVLAALAGESHPMHRLYYPRRFTEFMQ